MSCALRVRDAEPRELVVAPERAVDEHEVAGGEAGEHVVVQPGEPGHVGDDAAGRAVAEDEPARLSSSRVARRVAADANGSTTRLDPSSGSGRPGSSVRPLDAAVALAASRSTGYPSRQRALDARRAEDAHRRRRLAQQQQPGRVVDLGVGQQHAGDRRRADAVDARGVERLELLAQVGRGVDEKPRPVVPADRERRLRAGSRAHAGARGLARPAVAVPLREASAGGRAQNADAHVARPVRPSAYRWNR